MTNNDPNWTFVLEDFEECAKQIRQQSPFVFEVKIQFERFCDQFRQDRFSQVDMHDAYDAFCRGWERGKRHAE